MAVKDILLLGDSRLYEVCKPVEQNESFLQEINIMFDTILDFRKKYGVGRAIAAPQIGLLKRIICVNNDQRIAMINPELSEFSEDMFEIWDDCMSFPNLLVKVKRHKTAVLTFFDLNWKKHQWNIEGDMAELIQHEYDHLNGILAIQRAINDKSFKWRK